ncbi:transposase [Achromobacter sp. SD115]|uniref:integrase core domain-containing protein n=1 Tax=Achromobacter sp. SD115 TaxID=2782011 RepID=UPI001A962E3E|nr:transposase [Achromobacter sp. SD115]
MLRGQDGALWRARPGWQVSRNRVYRRYADEQLQLRGEAWRQDYNDARPHMALKDLTPGEFARKYCLRQQVGGSWQPDH